MAILRNLFRPPIQDHPAEEKAATGIGSVMIEHGIPITFLNESSPAKKAKAALAAGRENPYIRMAERSIANRIGTVDWWLEDETDGSKVTGESSPQLRAVHDLLERPYRPQKGDPINASPRTFGALRQVTIRHAGLAGVGYWYLVGVEALAGTPSEILYISPDRMTPAQNAAGQLIGWVLDADSGGRGVPFTTEEIIPFYLEPPDQGFLPTGLVETAAQKATIARLGDKHATYILGTGGRMPGIYHPPANGTIPEEVYQALVQNLRSIMEAPDAAKRSIALKGPVEFTETSKDPGEMQLLEMLAMARDDILGLWGVPRSQLGYERKFSLGGTADDMDAEVFYANGWGPRAKAFFETLNLDLLSRYRAFGIDVEAEYEEPEFDDDAALYDMVSKVANVPLRTVERRKILGLPAFGDERDDEVWMPINVGLAFTAAPHDPGEAMKASPAEIDRRISRMRDDVARFLKDQSVRIGKRIENKADHIARKPRDTDAWWDQDAEDAALMAVLAPHVMAFAEMGAEDALTKLNG